MAKSAFVRAINTLVAVGRTDVAWDLLEEALVIAQEKKPWEDLPHGWSMKSVRSLWRKLGGSDGDPKKCMEKMKGKVRDEARFCASLKDKAEGKTTWRGKD